MAIHEKSSLPPASGILSANKDVVPPTHTDNNELLDTGDQDEALMNGKVESPISRKNSVLYRKSEGKGSSTNLDNKLFGFVSRNQDNSPRKVKFLFHFLFLFLFLLLPVTPGHMSLERFMTTWGHVLLLFIPIQNFLF